MDLQTELHQRLSEIGSHVELAAAAAGGRDAPGELVALLRRLRELSLHAKQLYMTSGRECELTDCLAALETVVEQACALCQARPNRHELPAATLDEARQEIRDLRHQIDSRAS